MVCIKSPQDCCCAATTCYISFCSAAAAFAMSATWLVLTLAPARRANACCFKSTTSCTFRYDVSSDTQFAVQYGLTVIAWAVMMLYGTGPGALGVILSAVIMALLIATAVLSSKMGRASAQEQEAPGRSGFDASTNPNVAPGTATASLYGCSAAPSKVVEVVAPGNATASMYFGSAAPPKVMEIV